MATHLPVTNITIQPLKDIFRVHINPHTNLYMQQPQYQGTQPEAVLSTTDHLERALTYQHYQKKFNLLFNN